MDEAQVRQMLNEQATQLQAAMTSALADAQSRVQAAEQAMQQQAAEAQARVQAAESLAQQVLHHLGGRATMTTHSVDTDGLAELRSIIDVRILEKMEHFWPANPRLGTRKMISKDWKKNSRASCRTDKDVGRIWVGAFFGNFRLDMNKYHKTNSNNCTFKQKKH